MSVMRSLENTMVLATGLAAPLGRAVVRGILRRSPSSTRRGSVGWRCVAAALALALGLGGVSPCLCAAEPGRTSDPHACCGHSAGSAGGVTTNGPFLKTCAIPCCASQTAVGLAARLGDHEVLKHTLVAAVATASVMQRHVVPSTAGASASPLYYSSPPRTTVLRI